MKLKVAVIGCGRIAPVHFASIDALSNLCQLVACCDIDVSKANVFAQKYHVNAYADYKQMLDCEQIDAVHLCLPHDLHVPVAIYCMQRGVHVLCEKPMAINYKEALQAVNVAKQENKQYGVIFQIRYTKPSQFVKQTLNSGKLGNVLGARSILTWQRNKDYYLQSDWKGTWAREGGGVLINQAIHSVDLVNWLIASNVKSISCNMAKHKHGKIEVEDTAEGVISYDNGANYVFFASNNYCTNEPIEIKLYCEKGQVTLDYNKATIIYPDGTSEVVTAENEMPLTHSTEYWGSTHICQIRQFYNACLGNEPLISSGEQALNITKLICDIYDIGKRNLVK